MQTMIFELCNLTTVMETLCEIISQLTYVQNGWFRLFDSSDSHTLGEEMHSVLFFITKRSETSKNHNWAFALCEITDQSIELITDCFGVQYTCIYVFYWEKIIILPHNNMQAE